MQYVGDLNKTDQIVKSGVCVTGEKLNQKCKKIEESTVTIL